MESYLNEPLLLTKDKAGDINCLSNVCTHRGNIVAYKASSKAATFRCKYYGRLFVLSGKFISIPDFKEIENFPCEEDKNVLLHIATILRQMHDVFQSWLQNFV